MGLCQGRGSWALGKGSAPKSRGHSPKLLELKHLAKALRNMLLFFGWSVWSQELDSMTVMVPSQRTVFCDSAFVVERMLFFLTDLQKSFCGSGL